MELKVTKKTLDASKAWSIGQWRAVLAEDRLQLRQPILRVLEEGIYETNEYIEIGLLFAHDVFDRIAQTARLQLPPLEQDLYEIVRTERLDHTWQTRTGDRMKKDQTPFHAFVRDWSMTIPRPSQFLMGIRIVYRYFELQMTIPEMMPKPTA